MRWKFSDGTTVDLGGKVDGPTLLAQRLRAQFALGFRLQVWPQPCESHEFDPNDPALLEEWLRQELDFWTRIRGLDLTLKSPKGIPALPAPPWGDEVLDANVIY